MEWRYLDLAEYLAIAEAVLGIPIATLALLNRLDLADSALNAPSAGIGEVELYTTFERKAAVLLSRLIRNRPLPDRNEQAALVSVIEFVERNGRAWTRSPGDPADTDTIIRGVATGTVSEAELEEWIRARTEKV